MVPPISITTDRSTIKLTKRVMIQPLATLHATGLCKVTFIVKGLDVMVEAGGETFF